MSLKADVIVGADGVNSAVRSTGGFESRVSSGSSYVRSIVRGRASPWFEEYWTPLGSFGQAPLGGDLIYFWAAAQVGAAADAVARRDLGAFRHEWRRVLPAAADLSERVSSFDDLLVNTAAGSTVGAGSPAAWFCSATPPMPWPRTWARARTVHWSTAWS